MHGMRGSLCRDSAEKHINGDVSRIYMHLNVKPPNQATFATTNYPCESTSCKLIYDLNCYSCILLREI